MKFALILLLSLATVGCAFGSRRVNLLYGDRVTTPVAAPASRSTVAVAKFSDARAKDAQGQRLGWIKDTYGIPTAPVVALQDPVLWVSDGVARALESRGYRVERVDASPTGVPTVTGTVTRVYSSMYANIQADIEANVTIDRDRANVFSTPCKGSVTWPAGSISASEYEGVFSAAMD